MLDNAIKYLKTIPDINNGGCGIAALALYRVIKDSGVKTEFVTLTDLDYIKNNNSKRISNNEYPTSNSHIVLVVNDIPYDSNGRYYMGEYDYHIPFNSEELLLEAINEDSWNRAFDRDRYTPLIAKHLNIDLSDIKPYRETY